MPLFNAKSLNTQNDILMQNLLEFYKTNENMERFLDIVHGPRSVGSEGEESSNTISLRIIDWFVTNYAKKYYTTYDIVPLSHGHGPEVPSTESVDAERPVQDGRARFVSNCVTEHTRFKVYNDYKLKLKAYSKRRFDPFCRWERIQLPFTTEQDDTPKHMETTIGQLNFFKWAIENHILDYIQAHYHDIERDMNTRNTTSKHRNLTETSTESVDSYASNSSNSYDSGKTGTEMTNTCSKTRKKREELSISACKCIRKETVKILVKFS
jgi:hypothetical protein